MELSKNLKLAREARAEDNTEDAKMYYQKVREEEPENGEAKFFYAYYSLYEGKVAEIPGRFENLCKTVSSSIQLVKKSQLSKEEQLKIVEAIVKTFVPEIWVQNRYMNKKNQEQKIGNTYVRIFSVSEISNCSKIGMRAVRDLGDQIDQLYKGDPIAQKYAVSAWKEYVSLAQTWYAYAPKGEAEVYAEKIKKIEPSYVMPSKAGCISFGKKQ